MSDDDPGDLFDTDNVVVCQFDKVCELRYIVEAGLSSQGWRSGERTRLTTMWVDFVGSLLCAGRFFPWYVFQFSPLTRNQHLISCDSV